MGDAPQDHSRSEPSTAPHSLHGGPDQGQAEFTQFDPRFANHPAAFHTQFGGLSQQGHGTDMSQPTTQLLESYAAVQGHDPRGLALNMGAMAGALPDHSPISGNHGVPHAQRNVSTPTVTGGPPPPALYQFQQVPQFSGAGQGAYQTYGGMPNGYPTAPYPQPYMAQQAGQSGGYVAFPQGQHRPAHMQQTANQFQQPPPGYYYYPHSATPTGPYSQMTQPVYQSQSRGNQNNRVGMGQGQDGQPSRRAGGNLDTMNSSSEFSSTGPVNMD